jgi:hypothetical protein
MTRIILASMEINELFCADDAYMKQKLNESNQLYIEVSTSEKKKWLQQRGAKIEYQEITDHSNQIRKHIYFTNVDESIAVEYYLRF